MATHHALPEVLEASWRRCARDHHLSRHTSTPITRLLDTEVSSRRESLQGLLARSAPQIDRVRRLAKEADHCVLVSDPDGIVVAQYNDTTAAQALARGGLTCGSAWHEAVAGTNAIAMALRERATVTVAGNDHYFTSLAPFWCTAAALLDHRDDVVGALDISGLHRRAAGERIYARHLLAQLAAEIQAILFQRHHQDRLLLTIARRPDNFANHVNALIAVDPHGIVVGATRQAAAAIGAASPDQILNTPIEPLIGAGVDALLAAAGRQIAIDLTGAQRGFALARAPMSRKAVAPPGSTRSTGPKVAPMTRTLDDLAGADPTMRHNVAICRRILDRHIPIILYGETGVGKDSFAKALHGASARKHHPFIALNCAATPATLLDSELFGYAPGTFTGGLKSGKTGKIAASNRGTLFLDEIGDMPLELQGRLLRVLADQEVTPLGALTPVPVEVNIICATHRNLAQLVETGAFREDLYYRLNGATVALPALRARADFKDIVAKLLHAEATPPPRISAAALSCLADYHWPGNIRQLINTLRLAVACGNGGDVDLEDLPEEIRIPCRAVPPDRLVSLGPQGQNRRDTERARLIEALQNVDWCVSKAARHLGISRATLHRKINAHGIVRPGRLHQPRQGAQRDAR